MEIRGVSGGKDFSIVKFKDKLGYATKYNSLKDKRDNILKVVRGSQAAIRAGRFNASGAMSKLKSLNKDLSYDEAGDIKKMFKQLGDVPASKTELPRETSAQKAFAAAEAKKAAKLAEIHKFKDINKLKDVNKPSLARTNRDTSSYLDDTTKHPQERTGLASGSVSTGSHYNVGANRGQTLDKNLETRDVSGSIKHERINL